MGPWNGGVTELAAGCGALSRGIVRQRVFPCVAGGVGVRQRPGASEAAGEGAEGAGLQDGPSEASSAPSAFCFPCPTSGVEVRFQ